MGRIVHEDELHVYHTANVANISAPTLAEITGDGVDLTPHITADGVAINPTANTASVDMLEGKVRQAPGTRGYAPTLTGLRDDESDEFWDEFSYAQRGFLIISRFGVPEAGSPVEVYEGAAQEPAPTDSEGNSFQTAEVQFPAEDWDLKAVVAAV